MHSALVQDIGYHSPRAGPDFAELLGSWELHLRAERKSPHTVESYGDGVRAYLVLVRANGKPVVLDRQQLREFIDDLLTAAPSPHRRRPSAGGPALLGLAGRGGEQDADPLLGVQSPKLDKPVIEPLTDDELRAMLKACRGPDLRDKRDEAILRLMFTTGARAGEVVALQVDDLDLRAIRRR